MPEGAWDICGNRDEELESIRQQEVEARRQEKPLHIKGEIHIPSQTS